MFNIFVNFCHEIKTYQLPKNATLRDLKKIVKKDFGYPLYLQKFHGLGSKKEKDPIVKYDNQTFIFYLPLFGGPENFEFNKTLYDTLNVQIALPNVLKKLKMSVMAYWDIASVIKHILEEIDDYDYTPPDVQLNFRGNKMPDHSKICEYKSLTRGYMQFNQLESGLPAQYKNYIIDTLGNITATTNPYGYIVPIGRMKKQTNSFVVLELKNPKEFENSITTTCMICFSNNIYATLPCSHSLCNCCIKIYNFQKCIKCNKDIFQM